MDSIKNLYKIGYGPSSSHTMGPAKAAEIAKKEANNASFFEVIIYNSLALTGEGHLTNYAITNELKPIPFKIIKKLSKKKHPNHIVFKGYKNKKLIYEKAFNSIGGGDILVDGQTRNKFKQIYKERNFNEIKQYCKKNKLTLAEYVYKIEGAEIKEYLKKVWKTMKEAIIRGLKTNGTLPGPLKVERKASILYNTKSFKNESPQVKETRFISAYAYAVSEENASGGIIVTAPTCGASGVLPAVLYYMSNKYKFITEERIIDALAVAGLIGNIIRTNATISGAVGGCQAEVGSAISMAAGACATLFKLSIEKVEYACEIAMEHSLGLTCDPINGYVQIPCIERNAVGALKAINACNLSYFLVDTRKISFDMVVKTMYQTGLDMNEKYRETSKGGLAYYYNKKGS